MAKQETSQPQFVNTQMTPVSVFDEQKRPVTVQPLHLRGVHSDTSALYVVEGEHYRQFVAPNGPLTFLDAATVGGQSAENISADNDAIRRRNQRAQEIVDQQKRKAETFPPPPPPLVDTQFDVTLDPDTKDAIEAAAPNASPVIRGHLARYVLDKREGKDVTIHPSLAHHEEAMDRIAKEIKVEKTTVPEAPDVLLADGRLAGSRQYPTEGPNKPKEQQGKLEGEQTEKPAVYADHGELHPSPQGGVVQRVVKDPEDDGKTGKGQVKKK